MTSNLSNSIESIYSDLRKLFNIQFHEFYRQYKEKTLNPEKLLEDFTSKEEYLNSIIESAESKDEDHFGLREQLDIITAEFVFAFLMKLDEEYPSDE